MFIRDWLTKPQRMLRVVPATPDAAVAWLGAEYEQIQPQIAGDIGVAIDAEQLMRQKLYDMRCGVDTIIIVRWLRGGAMVHLAVLAVSATDCDQHGR